LLEIAMASARIAGLFIVFIMLSASCASAQIHTTIDPALPSLAGDEKKNTESGTSEGNVYCRPPQPLLDSRLMGPQVCMPVQKWNDLHAAGMDVDARGDVKPRQRLDDLKTLNH
jgi:hypothetical protein